MNEKTYKLCRGDTFNHSVLFRYTDETVVDLSGFIGECQVRRPSDSKLMAQMVCSTNATTGTVNMSLDRSATSLLAKGCYRWDLRITSSDNTFSRHVAGGDLIVSEPVTE